MVTYSSNRLIMGKVEIDNFCQGIEDIFKFIFTEIFIEYSSMFHTTFVKSLNLIG